MDHQSLRQLLSLLLLSIPTGFDDTKLPDEYQSAYQPILVLRKGNAPELVQGSEYDSILYNPKARSVLEQYPAKSLNSVISEYVEYLKNVLEQQFGIAGSLHLHILAIAFLQTFIQSNFTGPAVSFDQTLLFPGIESLLQVEALKLLSLEGQLPYDLMVDPVFFILSSKIFEVLMDAKSSLVGTEILDGGVIDEVSEFVNNQNQGGIDAISASIMWWRSRALQVHLSLFSEPPSIIPTLSTLLLTPQVVNGVSAEDIELKKHIQIIYFLESARISIHSQTEHLAVPLLAQAREVSGLDLVLTGAKAKRTKFQKFVTSNLLVLAKSKESQFFKNEDNSTPESFELNSEVLLERPHFESLEDLEMPEERNTKRIKFDPSFDQEQDTSERLLPIAFKQEDIPEPLKLLDPNNQPPLNNLDNIQLLLRLTTLRQTSPAQNPLVEEELLALISRILYVDSKNVDWLVFSRALWERSLLETSKAKTIERGILQMTSLVEEIGIKIKSRIIPQAEDVSPVSRLRFVHQMELMPQWSMDVKLAEKYMSIGVLRSALEIYERLHLSCEAALCYAAVDNEPEAERVLLARIQSHPEDARAVSILGDLKQDPTLWEKSWQIGRYHRAKASLSRYYYAPPSGARNFDLAIKHMNDCLKANPLNYENWFFYGCLGLESEQYDLAAEAFSRCAALDDTNSHAWSNLGTALLRSGQARAAFNALKKALRSANENKRSWKIYENYLLVALQLNEWNDVLLATRELLDIRGNEGEGSIDIPVIEKLVEILVSTDYPVDDTRMTHYQRTCIDVVCNILPKVITTSSRCWRIVARVELWRKKPWASLECHEKAYRAVSSRADLDTSEQVWNEAVEACSDLTAAYESLGEMPGKHGAGDLVCKDWKYKARSSVRGLMSKGKQMWEDSQGWYKLQELKEEFS